MLTPQRLASMTMALLFTACFSARAATVVAEWNFDAIGEGNTLRDQVGTINGTINVAAPGEMALVASGAGVPGATGFLNAYENRSSSISTNINLGTTATTEAISNFGTGAFSVAGWFDANERNSGTNDRWIIGDLGGTGGFIVYLYRGSGSSSDRGKLRVAVGGGANQVMLTSPTRLDLNSDTQQWHWFAATSDGSTLKLYIDGVYISSVAYLPGTTATPDSGSNALISRAFDGRIDQLTVWNGELAGVLDGNNNLVSGDLYNLWRQNVVIPEPGTASLLLISTGLFAFFVLRKPRRSGNLLVEEETEDCLSARFEYSGRHRPLYTANHMETRNILPGRSGGFTLVEIALALGVFSVAIVGMLSLLAVGMGNFQSAKQTQAEAEIMQQIAAEVQLARFSDLANTAASSFLKYFDERGVTVESSAPNCLYTVKANSSSNTTLPGYAASPQSLLVLNFDITRKTDLRATRTFALVVSDNGR